MARKHKHEQHENHEPWLISYAAFITLLFAFFVVMYSISSVNEGKFRGGQPIDRGGLKSADVFHDGALPARKPGRTDLRTSSLDRYASAQKLSMLFQPGQALVLP